VPVYALDGRIRFPDPRDSEEDGLLAAGGDLSVPRLLEAYARGIFPWYSEGQPLLWWSPPERAVFLRGDGRLPRSTRRILARVPFEVRVDTSFEAVVAGCAEVPRAGQGGTWITREMRRAYGALHRAGFAHCFEAWRDGKLRGGLYGVSLGGAFFGESMFSLEPGASRAAFRELCGRCWEWGFDFIDGQAPNANLHTLGARILDRETSLELLARALEKPTRRGAW
jgi:leucyl/phenylalanyl-tRNA--protein transferase